MKISESKEFGGGIEKTENKDFGGRMERSKR